MLIHYPLSFFSALGGAVVALAVLATLFCTLYYRSRQRSISHSSSWSLCTSLTRDIEAGRTPRPAKTPVAATDVKSLGEKGTPQSPRQIGISPLVSKAVQLFPSAGGRTPAKHSVLPTRSSSQVQARDPTHSGSPAERERPSRIQCKTTTPSTPSQTRRAEHPRVQDSAKVPPEPSSQPVTIGIRSNAVACTHEERPATLPLDPNTPTTIVTTHDTRKSAQPTTAPSPSSARPAVWDQNALRLVIDTSAPSTLVDLSPQTTLTPKSEPCIAVGTPTAPSPDPAAAVFSSTKQHELGGINAISRPALSTVTPHHAVRALSPSNEDPPDFLFYRPSNTTHSYRAWLTNVPQPMWLPNTSKPPNPHAVPPAADEWDEADWTDGGSNTSASPSASQSSDLASVFDEELGAFRRASLSTSSSAESTLEALLDRTLVELAERGMESGSAGSSDDLASISAKGGTLLPYGREGGVDSPGLSIPRSPGVSSPRSPVSLKQSAAAQRPVPQIIISSPEDSSPVDREYKVSAAHAHATVTTSASRAVTTSSSRTWRAEERAPERGSREHDLPLIDLNFNMGFELNLSFE